MSHFDRAAYGGLALRSAVVLATTAALTAVDQISKAWAFHELGLGRSHGDPRDFLRFVCHMNKGTAWGFCSGGQWYGLPTVVFLLGTAAAVAMAIAAARFEAGSVHGKVIGRFRGWFGHESGGARGSSAMMDALAFSMLVAGALGNALDRFERGAVIDFIDVGIGSTRWPTFNVADASLVGGIYLVLTGALADLVPRTDDAARSQEEPRGSSPFRIFVGVEATIVAAAVIMAAVGRACESSVAVHRAVLAVLSWLGVGVVALLLYGYVRLEMRRLKPKEDPRPPPPAET